MFGLLMTAAVLLAGDQAASPLAVIGPAPRTALIDASGKPFDLAALRGKVVVVSFVYTTCTGVCPATTQAMVGVRNALREAKLWGDSVEFVSITLDPQRDTAEVLRRYATSFRADDPAWHFLTGPPDEVRSVIDAWGMWVKMLPDGALDHPSRAFLLDRGWPPARDLQPRIPEAARRARGCARTSEIGQAIRRTSEPDADQIGSADVGPESPTDASAERLERAAHRRGVGIPVLGIAGQALLDDVGEPLRDIGAALADGDRLLLEQHADQVAAAGRLVVDVLAGQQVIERGRRSRTGRPAG